MTATRRRVVVVGAGLSGLVAALRASPGAEVLVLEQSGRLGGQIHTAREGERTVELGAEGFVARSVVLPKLCEDAGAGAELVDQTSTLTLAFRAGVLVDMEPGEAARALGFQVEKADLGRGIRSLRGGMGALIDALATRLAQLGVEVRRGVGVSRIGTSPRGLTVEPVTGPTEPADAVIVATPAKSAANLLAGLAPEAEGLAEQSLLSNASVNLLYGLADLGVELRGSGVLVEDQTACFGVRALSFASHKFARPRPEGEVVLRAFFRPTAEELGAPDATFVDRAASAARELLGTKGAPQRAWVSRWPEALTVYDERTRELVERADQALAPLGVYLAGSHYHGAGIDRAVASAERAAARALGLGDG